MQLMRHGNLWQVNQPWEGPEIMRAEVRYSAWHKAIIAQLLPAHTASPTVNRIEFSIFFPEGTTFEEAEQCAATYMLLLNMVRTEEHDDVRITMMAAEIFRSYCEADVAATAALMK